MEVRACEHRNVRGSGRREASKKGKILKQIALLVIKIYRATCWMKVPCCRFYPSCSKYALEAIERYGVILGSWLAVCRILRCHPFHPGGVDEVPQKPRTT